ncbi:MAG: YwaF family protein [Clostridia bacterium]|nr:YwaF family protein [Clostridia bacterium]
MSVSYFYVVIMPYFLIAMLAVASRYLSERVLYAVMLVIYAAMLAFEVGKQTDAIMAEGGYIMSKAPLHFSSTFYITIGLCLFGGKRVRHVGQSVLFVSGLILAFLMLATPKSIFGVSPSGVFNSAETIHGYFFHMAVLLNFAVLLARGVYNPKLTDPVIFAAFAFVYAAIAAPVAIKTNTNFCGLVTSYIPILESYRQANGQAAYLIVYFVGASELGAIAIYIYHSLRNLYKKISLKHNFNLSEKLFAHLNCD